MLVISLILRDFIRVIFIIVMALQPFVGPWPLSQFLNLKHSQ
jgi:hypothetical protein